MNKKTQMIIGVVAVAGLGYWLYTKNKKDKIFANASGRSSARRKDEVGCVIYAGGCLTGKGGGLAPVGSVLSTWQGTQGIIVANSDTRCLVCPKSNTTTGLPS